MFILNIDVFNFIIVFNVYSKCFQSNDKEIGGQWIILFYFMFYIKVSGGKVIVYDVVLYIVIECIDLFYK